MATNVTEKDETLQEIIDWCEQLAAEGLRLASALLMQHDMDAYGVVSGQVNAYEKTADHCRSLLGHSGSMPTEVPNQSEDTEMTCRRLPDAKGWYLTADHARLLRYDGYTWTAYTTDGDETELNDGYSTTADPDLLIRTLGAHRLPLTRLDLTAQHG